MSVSARTIRWIGLGVGVEAVSKQIGPRGGPAREVFLCEQLAIALSLDQRAQHQRADVVSAFFLRPGEKGPAKLMTEPVRAGRRTATGEARLIQYGKERVRLLATFGEFKPANGHAKVFSTPPELPPPDRALDPLAAFRPVG